VVRLFDELAPVYDGILRAYSLGQDLRWKDVLIRRLRPQGGERALDLACGTGLILERLTRIVGETSAVGMDLNRAMLRELLRRRGKCRIVQADAERLPFASGTFDVVTAGYLLKYVRLERFLPELARVLRPGGRFGGYDFSRPTPGTLSGTLYSVYLHRMLPWLGRGGSGRAASWRDVFEFLSQITETSRWEDRARDRLSQAGFTDVELISSLGGAITWVWARKG
jgi:demethylmenaquinone methyltransferase/2-methoxy-6-polyprenyl-1,4-benzoquinol methylase